MRINKELLKSGSIYFEPSVGYFKVESIDEDHFTIILQDRSESVQRSLADRFSPLTADHHGLGHLLFGEQDDVAKWIDLNPARVAVAALIDLNRRGTVGQIRERIEPLITTRWERWWRTARAQLENTHFVRIRPDRSFRVDQGFEVSDVDDPEPDSLKPGKARLSQAELEEAVDHLISDPAGAKALRLSDFRRVLGVLDERSKIGAVLDDLHLANFVANQLWSLFDLLSDPVERSKVAARAIDLATNHHQELLKDRQRVPQAIGRLPNDNELHTLESFLPELMGVLHNAHLQGRTDEIERIADATLGALLGRWTPGQEPATSTVEQLLVHCIRLRPAAFLRSLLLLNESAKRTLIDRRIIDRVFSRQNLSPLNAKGTWLTCIAEPEFDSEIASSLSHASYTDDSGGSLTQSIAAAIRFQVEAVSSGGGVDLEERMMAALAGSISDENALKIESQIVAQARARSNPGAAARPNSLVEIIVKAISGLTNSQRSTNRRLRSDLKNLSSDISRLDNENNDLKNRLSDLSRESALSVAQGAIDAQRALLRQVANALQFTQAGVARSGDVSRIDNFARIMVELEQYLPLRSRGLLNEQVPYDPENLDWKGDRSHRPAVGESVTIIALGWVWNPKPGTSETLARTWCTADDTNYVQNSRRVK